MKRIVIYFKARIVRCVWRLLRTPGVELERQGRGEVNKAVGGNEDTLLLPTEETVEQVETILDDSTPQ